MRRLGHWRNLCFPPGFHAGVKTRTLSGEPSKRERVREQVAFRGDAGCLAGLPVEAVSRTCGGG